VVRHGATFPDQADTDPLNPENIAAQRQLNDKGKAAAKAFGHALRQIGVRVSQVHTSQFNRAYQTALLAGLSNIEKTADLTEGGLGPLASRYVKVDDLPWKPTPCPGIDMKVLLEDKETGLLTALFRWQPGSELSLHEHVEVEQTFVIEGSLVDDEGEVTAGNYVWRPKGNRHIAKSPNGALVLSIFLKPNIFLGGAAEGQQLR